MLYKYGTVMDIEHEKKTVKQQRLIDEERHLQWPTTRVSGLSIYLSIHAYCFQLPSLCVVLDTKLYGRLCSVLKMC